MCQLSTLTLVHVSQCYSYGILSAALPCLIAAWALLALCFQCSVIIIDFAVKLCMQGIEGRRVTMQSAALCGFKIQKVSESEYGLILQTSYSPPALHFMQHEI